MSVAVTTEIPLINLDEDGKYIFILARYGPHDRKRCVIRVVSDGITARESTDQNHMFSSLDHEDPNLHFERRGGGWISADLGRTVIYYSCARIDVPAANGERVARVLREAFPEAHISPV